MQEFAEYKANRTETPPDLGEQIPYVRRVLEAMRIPILEYPGFEADDVIGTIARRAEQAGFEVVIVSSDKDMLQLVTDRVSMLNPAKDDEWYDPAKVKEFLGVRPEQVADLLALKGDAIDNIPGAPGIGDKGAQDLIEHFGSVEAALERAAKWSARCTARACRTTRAHPHEQAPGDHRDRRADRVLAGIGEGAAGRRGAAEGRLQGAGVPQPAEGTGPGARTRGRAITGALGTPEELTAWLAAIPRGRAGGGGDCEIRRRRVGARYHRAWPGSRARRAR